MATSVRTVSSTKFCASVSHSFQLINFLDEYGFDMIYKISSIEYFTKIFINSYVTLFSYSLYSFL
jgi:hypothetical protein